MFTQQKRYQAYGPVGRHQRQTRPSLVPRLPWGKVVLAIVVCSVAVAAVIYGMPDQARRLKTSAETKTAPTHANSTAVVSTPAPKPNACAGNTLDQNVLISISKRHMWACAGVTVQYDSAVVTGMQNLAADLTPTGTYHIYGKQTNLYLKGSDSTGSWNDYVYYWMPWLSNQYGVYGFHDATWRKDSDFGNIDPYTADASHGCVELPLATAKWLYNWAQIGTTVTIES